MESKQPTIVLVLKSGGDFAFRDVELITRHILGLWQSEIKPRIILLWDKASESYDLGNIEVVPLKNTWRGTWSRMELYSPEMEQYRPFLYIDLDTAIIQSVERIFALVKTPSLFIALEDLWHKTGQIATPLVWFPANSRKIEEVWTAWNKSDKEHLGFRMDHFLQKVITPDLFWQQLTTTLYDFKPKNDPILRQVPSDATMVLFHGSPRIFQVAEASISLDWIKNYVDKEYTPVKKKVLVTVIIPYKVDRGWLKEAIDSVPKDVQLLVSQGEGNWPENFNKVLHLAEGKYIRYLHEDDKLTPNCIADSVKAIEAQDVHFIHGDAIEVKEGSTMRRRRSPSVQLPSLADLLKSNVIHSETTMYRREVFEMVGKMDETLNTAEEYEFHLRCLSAGLRIGYCPSVLAIYRRHPLQKVRTVTKSQKDEERLMVQTKYLCKLNNQS
jgi:hypothetical protein